MPNLPSPDENPAISQFEKLLVGLAKAEVEFAVAGGLAVILNGYPRVTLDLDIIVHDSTENLARLLEHLKGWGEGWARELSPEDFQPQEGSIRVTEDFELDIFTRMRGHTFAEFRPGLKTIDLSGTKIYILSPADLIELKKDSWREKDQMDVAALRKIIEARKEI